MNISTLLRFGLTCMQAALVAALIVPPAPASTFSTNGTVISVEKDKESGGDGELKANGGRLWLKAVSPLINNRTIITQQVTLDGLCIGKFIHPIKTQQLNIKPIA